ncbi:MAG: helix-turn-helix transcriptional regulator [Rickettsiaceae bacterium]|nr:helix-turn-helix transcriptional regulator [Rickettsiaceae bacterium]
MNNKINYQLFLNNFGYNVKYYRIKAGLTEMELAGHLMLTREYIMDIENGETCNVSLIDVFQISNILNISPNLLFKTQI